MGDPSWNAILIRPSRGSLLVLFESHRMILLLKWSVFANLFGQWCEAIQATTVVSNCIGRDEQVAHYRVQFTWRTNLPIPACFRSNTDVREQHRYPRLVAFCCWRTIKDCSWHQILTSPALYSLGVFLSDELVDIAWFIKIGLVPFNFPGPSDSWQRGRAPVEPYGECWQD